MNLTTDESRKTAAILRAIDLARIDLANRLAVGWDDMAERRRVQSLLKYHAAKQLADDAAINAQAAGVPTYLLSKRKQTNRKG
jgi:hypothetical protein